jgi:hypothetical protein
MGYFIAATMAEKETKTLKSTKIIASDFTEKDADCQEYAVVELCTPSYSN